MNAITQDPELGAGGRSAVTLGRVRGLAGKLTPVWAVLLAFLVGAIPIAAAGVNPLDAYSTVLTGALGGPYELSVTVRFMIPLCLAGLAVAIPYRCGLFNIGAEGQLALGAVAALAVSLYVPAPPGLHVLLCLLAAAAAGALWGAVPGALLAFRHANEVITTIMLNFVALFILQYLVRVPWRSGEGLFPVSKDVPESARLAELGATGNWHMGLFVALAAVAVAWVLVYRTRFGLSLKIMGKGLRAAHNVGISVKKMFILSMSVGGLFAGLAGSTELLGVQYNLSPLFNPGYGFDAIGIAILSRGNPLLVLVFAFVFGGLRAGVTLMQRVEGVPAAIGQVLIALPVIFLAIDAARQQYSQRRLRNG